MYNTKLILTLLKWRVLNHKHFNSTIGLQSPTAVRKNSTVLLGYLPISWSIWPHTLMVLVHGSHSLQAIMYEQLSGQQCQWSVECYQIHCLLRPWLFLHFATQVMLLVTPYGVHSNPVSYKWHIYVLWDANLTQPPHILHDSQDNSMAKQTKK